MIKRLGFVFVALSLGVLGPLAACELVLTVRPVTPLGLDYGFLLDRSTAGGMKAGLDCEGVGGHARTTARGLRGEEWVAGRLRVLGVGDSFTVGYRLGNDDLWTLKVARALGGTGQIMAAGSPDASTRLAKTGMDREADLILVGICLGNDVVQAAGAWTTDPAYFETATTPGVVAPEQTLCFKPRLFPHLGDLLSSVFPPPEVQVAAQMDSCGRILVCDAHGGYVTHLVHPPAQVEVGFAWIAKALATIRHPHVVAVIMPQRYTVQPADREASVRYYGLDESKFDWDRPRIRMAEELTRAGVRYVDTVPALRALHERTGRTLYQPLGDMHMNALGQDGVTTAVLEALRRSSYSK